MFVEACRQGKFHIAFLTVASDRDQTHPRQLGELTQMARQPIAIHSRQADVEEGELWFEQDDERKCSGAVVDDPRFAAYRLQQHRERLRCIGVVVDDRH